MPENLSCDAATFIRAWGERLLLRDVIAKLGLAPGGPGWEEFVSLMFEAAKKKYDAEKREKSCAILKSDMEEYCRSLVAVE